MRTNWDRTCSHVLNYTNAKVFISHGMDSNNSISQKFHQIAALIKLTNVEKGKTKATVVITYLQANRSLHGLKMHKPKIDWKYAHFPLDHLLAFLGTLSGQNLSSEVG